MERKSLSCADTAKLIRADLKTNYPHVKFSVRSSVYSGGASIRVNWVDGPFIDDIERIAKRYEGASFDGSIDLKSYKPDTLMAFAGSETPVLVSFGSDYVFTDRELSPAYIEQLSAEAQKVLNLNQETAGQTFSYSDFYSRESLASDFGVIPYPVNGYSLVRYLSRHIAPSVRVGA